MATYQQMIDLALQQALVGGDQLRSALLDADMTMESLVQTVFQNVARKTAEDEEGRSLLRRTHTIALTNGVGVVPTDIALTQCKFGASISDPANVAVAQNQSLVLYWQDFVQPRTGLASQDAWWIIKGDDDLHYIEPNESYDPSSGFTGDIELTIASVPAIPATASDPVVVVGEIFSDLVTALAVAIRGLVAANAKADA